MKLIEQYTDLHEAQADAVQLEANGIAVHVSSSDSHSLSKAQTGAYEVGVWAILEEQFEDAKALLNNPDHRVTTGLDDQAMTELKQQYEESSHLAMNDFMGYAVAFMCVLILIVFIVTRLD